VTRFYEYYSWPYRIDETPDGGLTGSILDTRTGRFTEKNEPLRKVMHATSTSDISALDEDEFVQLTERERAENLTGDGPIFALYDTVRATWDTARDEGRRITGEELALVEELYRRTFKMWEEEFARQDAGEPPSFQYRSKHALKDQREGESR